MEEVTEDELNQSLEWDSRNFGEKHFLPDGDKYKVIIIHAYYLFLEAKIIVLLYWTILQNIYFTNKKSFIFKCNL